MTDKEKIEINGVDVSGCSYYNPLSNYNCGGTKKCSQWSNCYYKQLNRKTAECEKLEEKWSIGFQKFCDKDNKLQHYKQALDEIEGLAKNFCKNCGDSKDCNDGKEGCYYSLIPDLFNSISKAKEADNESYK